MYCLFFFSIFSYFAMTLYPPSCLTHQPSTLLSNSLCAENKYVLMMLHRPEDMRWASCQDLTSNQTISAWRQIIDITRVVST
ncbi:hypothetical protein BGZ63DRAFT_383168 [Mariannaea sp. PMI_226]|nr:hypothetical protein BGZ63DRAFT_383168 [Mariannaea sp. PMI_226]